MRWSWIGCWGDVDPPDRVGNRMWGGNLLGQRERAESLGQTHLGPGGAVMAFRT